MSSLPLYLGVGALLAAGSAAQTYQLQTTYQGANFFNQFTFFTGADPNNGFVNYQTQGNAQALGIISSSSNSVRFGADSQNVYPANSTGRPAVRITSNQAYTEGLFVADIAHMPGQACGVWPSYWTLGSGTWPQNGEIDIIEGVNLNSVNQMTLHSGDGTCVVTGGGETGTLISNNCQTTSNGQIDNTAGCSVTSGVQNSYGNSFNSIGGGTYVMQWTDTFIKIWFFPRGQAPNTLATSSPDVSQFPTPDANFQGCDIKDKFKNHQIIFDIDFCGNWAAANGVYDQSCPLIAGSNNPDWQSCVEQVGNNPSDYSETYWEVNFVKVFQQVTTTVSSTSTTTSGTGKTTPISNDGTCGGAEGFTCQGSTFGNCCSQSGWCGSSSAYCGTGCQQAWGSCSGSSSSTLKTTTSSTTSTSAGGKPTPVSTDGTCGGAEGFTCQGSTFGNCCSQGGWCGSSSAYCGTGCQIAWGSCSGSSSSKSSTTTTSTTSSTKTTSTTKTSSTSKPSPVSTDGSCGGTKGFTCQGSGFGNCCSLHGWCGSTSAYCGTGCQAAYGTCSA